MSYSSISCGLKAPDKIYIYETRSHDNFVMGAVAGVTISIWDLESAQDLLAFAQHAIKQLSHAPVEEDLSSLPLSDAAREDEMPF
jgi:hypothetical protein